MDFEKKYSAYAEAVESALACYMAEFPADSDVAKAMAYSLLGGGKRVRGVLTLASCEAAGGSFGAALAAACAVEMLHCYSLIHDDLPCMDNDTMRRGKPSCHVQFGETTALLAGDALLTEAFRVISEIPDAAHAKVCVSILSKAAGAIGMVRGQELDLRHSDGACCSEQQLVEIHSLKTGCLLKASAAMGAVCAGADAAIAAALTDYAAKIGFAFQILDDVLDVTADEADFGKPVGSDADNGKTTFVTLFGLEGAKERAYVLTGEAEQLLKDTLPEPDAGFLAAMAWWLYNRKK